VPRIGGAVAELKRDVGRAQPFTLQHLAFSFQPLESQPSARAACRNACSA
jgi:hypothetical protein